MDNQSTPVEPETGTPQRTVVIDGVTYECPDGDCQKVLHDVLNEGIEEHEQRVSQTEVAGEAGESGNVQTVRQKRFPVIEIFGPVIQGEGSQVGNQTMFIRFGGCDYRCQKCDSLHAVIPQAVATHATYMTTEDILEKLWNAREETGVNWVTFSGGNPCMHKLDDLVNSLTMDGWWINVETQGTLAPEWLKHVTVVTVSPKSMGMGEKFNTAVYEKFLRSLNEFVPLCVKVVAFSAQDLEFALAIEEITKRTVPYMPAAYYLSLGNPYPPILDDSFQLATPDDMPVAPLGDVLMRHYARMCEEILPDPRLKNWRFLPQLHTLVYGNESGR